MASIVKEVILDQTKVILDVDLTLLQLIAGSYFVCGALVFVVLVYGVTAPYGRYSRAGWGVQVNGKLAWFLQESPSILIPVAFTFSDAPGLHRLPNLILFSLFVIHYIQRACIFPFLLRGTKAMPVVPCMLGLAFCTANGFLQSGHLLYHAKFDHRWYIKPHFIGGVCLFVFGLLTNVHSDHILRNLRKPGETGYKIPRGGMFQYVSGSNFFGEILEWIGFALACWSLPAFAFAFFTCCNIGPRAMQHHKFYVQKFEDYPKERRAILPYIL